MHVFLSRSTQARPNLRAAFENLNNVPGANQAEKDHIARVREAHRTWFISFAEPIMANIKAGGAATDDTLNLQGKALMDASRVELDQVVQDAENRRTARISAWRRQVHAILTGIFIVAVVMGVVIGLFARSRLHRVSAAYRRSLETLKVQTDELFESEQELRTTLSSIGDGVITCDADGRVQMLNPVAEELTGWSVAEAAGFPLEEVFRIVNESTRAVVENPVHKVKRLGGIVGPANHNDPDPQGWNGTAYRG